MVVSPQRESNPLEALQGWVNWAHTGGSGALLQNLQEGLPLGPGFSLQQSLLASRLPAEAEEVDWAAALKRQNAANDELCSENSQLQLEIERLQQEEAAAGSLSEEDSKESWLDELIAEVLEMVRGSLPASSSEPGEGAVLPRVEQAIRAANADEGSAATMAEEVAHLVSEKMALREQVERQQEQIEILEDQLREMGSAHHDGLLRDVLSKHVARGLSDAGGALSASLSAVLQPKTGQPPAVQVGGEVEIISGRGAIVRSGESLRSEAQGELPPGSRVRVVAASRKYPRRVEIVYAPEDSKKGLVGWISASSKDGRLLVRPLEGTERPVAERAAASAGSAGSAAAAQPQPAAAAAVPAESPKNSVTLSTQEWECLNEANAASAQQIEDLSKQLAAMGSQLLQSFEMQSVLAQLQRTVGLERDRRSALREAAAMASQELSQRAEEARAAKAAREHELRAACEPSTPAPESPAASPMAAVPLAIDWDRLVSERETTAAALSAGLMRLSCLQREAKEIHEEQLRSSDQELRPLRAQLRSRVEEAKASETPDETRKAASEGLFRLRAGDLSAQIRALRQELRVSMEGERTLRSSVAARGSAIQGLLHRAAMAGLVLPQCGPVRLAPDPDAERAALLAAVQEQLQLNLQLNSRTGHT
ncbi:unnamed protein product [Effrenium voratum]|uniref:Uncharacterized protein n=1 Tax=Effrenium voratum TaxID=2562239 RepID=A0AA36MUM5_9DINO|nr:unnamed protein product [Effrenium voratum]CAJ1423450.1 unnamed protein product [Effrenium voratum]